MKQVWALFTKEVLQEYRSRYTIGGLLLYIIAAIAVIYFTLNYTHLSKKIEPTIWSILFWLILLFSTIQTIANSFFKEQEGEQYYYYYISAPQHYILAKMLYNFLFSVLLAFLAYFIFSVMIGSPIRWSGYFSVAILLGSAAFAFLFSLMGAIANKAGKNTTLLAVLGFPIVIPSLIFVTKITADCIIAEPSVILLQKNLLILAAFDVIQIALAYILFPYIWRS